MKPVRVFTNLDIKEIIKLMMAANFRKFILLNMAEHKQPKRFDIIELPTDDIPGIIICKRRHVFFFWRKEILVMQKTSVGEFYIWHDEAKVRPLE